MAFVAITSATLTLRGKSGTMYVLPFTKATAVGFVTFTQDAQTFWTVPEDCQIVDCYVGDAVNAADYADVYLNSIQKIQMRIMVAAVHAATTVPHIASSSWIRGGSQFAMYYYSD